MTYASLTDRAMLVSLHVGLWSGFKYDREVSEDIARQRGAKRGSGRYNKKLVSDDVLKRVKTAASAIRAWHYYQTSPWDDAGPRILAADNFVPYSNEWRELSAEFKAAAGDVVKAYPAAVEKAERENLGGMFKATDYPSPDEIARKFYCDVKFAPLPTGEDFRVQIPDAAAAEVQAEIDARVTDAIQNVTADCWERLFKVVSHMADRLDAYRVDPETGKGNTRLYDSVVNNVAKLCDVLPRMNVAGDPALAQAVQEVQHKLAQYSIAELKEDGALRHDVAREASAIAARMASYGQRSAA